MSVAAVVIHPDGRGEWIQTGPVGGDDTPSVMGVDVDAAVLLPGEWAMYVKNDTKSLPLNPVAATIAVVMCQEHDLPLPGNVKRLRGPAMFVGLDGDASTVVDLDETWADFFQGWGLQF